MFDDHELVVEFNNLVNKDVAVPVCAMKFLISVIKKSQAQTWMELERNLRIAIDHLVTNLNRPDLHLSDKVTSFVDLKGRTSISLLSGCELFMKYVTNSFSLTTQVCNIDQFLLIFIHNNNMSIIDFLLHVYLRFALLHLFLFPSI